MRRFWLGIMMVAGMSMSATGEATPEVRWWDGTVASRPAGRLLSDNERYWGGRVHTGVTYTYETEPTAPPDIWRRDEETFGRRLLNGIGMRPPTPASWMSVQDTWVDPYLRVGVPEGPLVVVFDFKRPCTFEEVDLLSESKRVSVRLEARDAASEPWEPVAERAMESHAGWAMRRLKLSPAVVARYLRIRLEAAEGATYLNQVLAWGDADVEPAAPPKAYQPIPAARTMQAASTVSVPGIESTALSRSEFRAWRSELGGKAEAPALWAVLPTWDRLTDEPILPDPRALPSEVSTVMARNETEPRALALVNTRWSMPINLEVSLSAFRRLSDDATEPKLTGTVRVGGAIPSRNYGVNIGPLFAKQDLLDPCQMREYLTNGYGVARFPELTLSPAGAAVIWLNIEARDAPPGVYEATLHAGEGATLPVRVQVLDVTLPEARAWVHSWSDTTDMFPFAPKERLIREVDYKQALGISVWKGLPEKGTANALARARGHAIFYEYVVPWEYVEGGWTGALEAASLDQRDAEAIAQQVQAFVDRAEALGLSYDQWFGEIWDEPGPKNVAAFAGVARLVHQADPKVRLYCNPCFWIGGGVADDASVYEALRGWYRDVVDISVPLTLLLDHQQSYELFDQQRAVNAFYNVISQHAKSGRARHVLFYRRMPWDALLRGWDGWGFYSYHRPRGNAWDDFDRDLRSNEDMADYQIVYPGPRGPVPTRQSEAMRQGWEDYRLMRLLQKWGYDEAVEQLLAEYERGTAMTVLRERALQLAAKISPQQ